MNLAVLCKNDQSQLERCIQSCIDQVDHVTVIDTGSDDYDLTKEILRDNTASVPYLTYAVTQRPWVDFGHNRNELLAFSRWWGGPTLLLDADMTIEGEVSLPGIVKSPAYFLEVLDGSPETYWLPLIADVDSDAHYVGKTHEYLTFSHGEDDVAVLKLPSAKVRHHCDGSRRPTKQQEDLGLLRQAIADDPMDERAWFYLGNTLRDLGDFDGALEAFKVRAAMGGWDKEKEAAQTSVNRLEAGDTTPPAIPSP